MFGVPTKAESGTWLSYPLGAADLAVHLPDPYGDRVTVTWKGAFSPESLTELFVRTSFQVSGGRLWRLRAWRVGNDGPSAPFEADGSGFTFPLGFLDPDGLQFLRFERHPLGSAAIGSGDAPDLVVWANFDTEADDLESLQQSVGVQILRADLPALEETIAAAVSHTDMRFAWPGGGYDRASALARLRELRMDLTEVAGNRASG